MQHYFGEINNGFVTLSKDDLHHLINVKRVNIGEEIEISFNGKLFTCIVSKIKPLEIKVVSELSSDRELPLELDLAFSNLKSSSYNELIVMKGCEVGVKKFLVVNSDRSVAKITRDDNKFIRLEKIAKEACEQCRRSLIPSIDVFSSLYKIDFSFYDKIFFAYEGDFGKSNTLLSELKNIEKSDKILIIIGPEGGFSDKEISLARENNFIFVSLGKRILRAESAALYSCSIISSYIEEKF